MVVSKQGGHLPYNWVCIPRVTASLSVLTKFGEHMPHHVASSSKYQPASAMLFKIPFHWDSDAVRDPLVLRLPAALFTGSGISTEDPVLSAPGQPQGFARQHPNTLIQEDSNGCCFLKAPILTIGALTAFVGLFL